MADPILGAGRTCAVLLALLPALAAHAHETGLSYLRVRVTGASLEVELDLGLGDAAAALGLDATRDPGQGPAIARELLWERIAARAADLGHGVQRELALWQDGAPCAWTGDVPRLVRAEETGFARLRLAARCPAGISVLGLAWAPPFERDPQHRSLVSVSGGGAPQSAILSAKRRRVDLALGARAEGSLATYFVEGVRHIATGPDHLLFLVALLLPAPLAWSGRTWSVRTSAVAVIVEVVQVVTAFTAAHSLTLGLAALGLVAPAAAPVEAAIAASVLLAAANGIRPFLPGRPWRIAFAFGLLHGLGFARALVELGLPAVARLGALLAFNLGVEAGQLAIVAGCLPILLLLGRRPCYRRGGLAAASAVIAGIAAVWLVERTIGWGSF